MSEKPALGFVGIGRMGAPMARRLIDKGYRVTIFDSNEAALAPLIAAGAQRVASPAALAGTAEIVLLSLPTPDIVNRVAEDLLSGESRNLRAVIDLSTTGPKGSESLAARLAAAGVGCVDAPVSGGVAGAEKGTLAIMAAGEPALVEEVMAILECFGKVFVVGAVPGMGQTLKVINNLMSVSALAITSEALVLGCASGLDANVMIDVINASSGRNNATADKFPRFVLPRGFDFGFALGLSDKDTRLCLEHSDAMGVPMIVGSAVRQALKIALRTQGADADLTTIVKPLESWMGVEIKGSEDRET